MSRVLRAARAAAVVLAMLAASACGAQEPDAPPPSGSSSTDGEVLEAYDGSVSVIVPDGWKRVDARGKEPLQIAAQDPGTVDQLLVNVYDGPGDAEDSAVFLTTGLSDQGVTCERDDIGGREVFACPFEVDGTAYSKLFYAVLHEGRSALVLVQSKGSADEAARLAEPVLDSLTWR